MPDISMCPSTDCPLRARCYRNAASGTKPCERWQSWIGFGWYLDEKGEPACQGFYPFRRADVS